MQVEVWQVPLAQQMPAEKDSRIFRLSAYVRTWVSEITASELGLSKGAVAFDPESVGCSIYWLINSIFNEEAKAGEVGERFVSIDETLMSGVIFVFQGHAVRIDPIGATLLSEKWRGVHPAITPSAVPATGL